MRRRRSSEPGDGHRHFVGCDRACGSPPAGQVLVATGDGYRLHVHRTRRVSGCSTLHPRRGRDLPAVVRDDPRRGGLCRGSPRIARRGATDPHLRAGRRRRTRRLQRRRSRGDPRRARRGRTGVTAIRRWWPRASRNPGCLPATKSCRWWPTRGRPVWRTRNGTTRSAAAIDLWANQTRWRGAGHRQRTDRVVPVTGTRRRRRPHPGGVTGPGPVGFVGSGAVETGADRPTTRHGIPGGPGRRRW